MSDSVLAQILGDLQEGGLDVLVILCLSNRFGFFALVVFGFLFSLALCKNRLAFLLDDFCNV
jgi:hypothetical protein